MWSLVIAELFHHDGGILRPSRIVRIVTGTFTSSTEQVTATVGITSELIRGDIYYWGSLMAGAMLGSIPIIIVYVFFLDYYVSGLTAGAIK